MLANTLTALFERDLKKVINELELYRNEADLWRVEKEIANSAGNLVLHLIGNLNTYIGKELGQTGYVRNRELEFSLKDVSREELIAKLNETIAIIKNALPTVTDEMMQKEYPLVVLQEGTSTEYFLVHLIAHLNYHLGQINYHRRLVGE
jgi:uncharacterized damage-inducible protein DinB